MRALITGANGQDGEYLSEFLEEKGYDVFRGTRRSDFKSNWVFCDLRQSGSIATAIIKSSPDEIYNLAGQVFVPASWLNPAQTFDTNVGGLARILEHVERINPKIKVYQASSSEMFGNHNGPCNEETPFNPVSPYGVSKLAAHHLARVYRDKGLFVVSGILFNHESPFRGTEMVTRKITRAVAKWRLGYKDKLTLGNLKACRDWGFAGDYVRAMWLMMQQEVPQDFVIGTGVTRSVKEFLSTACSVADVEPGSMVIEPHNLRANELHSLCADAKRAHDQLKWWPEVEFRVMVKMMVDADVAMLQPDQVLA